MSGARTIIVLSVFSLLFAGPWSPLTEEENISERSEVLIRSRENSVKPNRNGNGNLTVVVINVSKGDSTLILSPSGKTMLIDTGLNGAVVVDTLEKYDIERIDYLISTHYDADHIGGVDEVVAGPDGLGGTGDDIGIGVALDRGDVSVGTTGYVEDYFDTLDEGDIPRRTPDVGEIIALGGGVDAKCVSANGMVLGNISPPEEIYENQRSLGFLITYGGFDILICGDMTWDIEANLAEGMDDGDVDILHLNHHGSASSTSWELLEKVWPENAVVSVGASNSYGHPTEGVMENLKWIRGPGDKAWFEYLYMTERGSGNLSDDQLVEVHGNIEISSDGQYYAVNGESYPTDELDTDGDGMPDIWETHVNLGPSFPMDADTDRDGDGLTELEEWEWWTCPTDEDTDKDGLPDGWEVENSLDPWDESDGGKDADRDGLTNLREYSLNSDPNNPDTDGDGMPDGWEVEHSLAPLDPDDVRKDPDGDGLSNGDEYTNGTEPDNPDTDGDGMFDGWEVRYGLDPLSDHDAYEDADGDNETNLKEFLNGSDPRVTGDDEHPEGDNGNVDVDVNGEDDDHSDETLNGTGRDEKEDRALPPGIYLIIGVIVVLVDLIIMFIFSRRRRNRGEEGTGDEQ